jgi:orotidine-5'-phosphate decarboxylase
VLPSVGAGHDPGETFGPILALLVAAWIVAVGRKRPPLSSVGSWRRRQATDEQGGSMEQTSRGCTTAGVAVGRGIEADGRDFAGRDMAGGASFF